MTRKYLWAATVFSWLLAVVAAGSSLADRAVMSAMRQTHPQLEKLALLRRTAIDGQLDLVLLIGGAPFPTLPDGTVAWGEQQTLGLFLQDRHDPSRVYLLHTEKGDASCWARAERITNTDTVISCSGDGGERRDYRKFIYDTRAKALVRQFRYTPFSAWRIFPRADGAVSIESNGEKLLAVEYSIGREPPFRILSDAAAQPWIARVRTSTGTEGAEARRVIYIENHQEPPPANFPALPRTTYDRFAASRPRRVKDGYVRGSVEIHDTVGPWQREGDRIWFGKSFYDGEGSTGVGGFGYFDVQARRLRMFEPLEIADWSVTAMAVSPEAVWMGLAWLGEGSTLGGGLLRFDRQSETVRRYDFPDIATAIAALKGGIVIASNFGLALLKEDRISRYFIDRMSDGRYRVAEAAGRANPHPQSPSPE